MTVIFHYPNTGFTITVFNIQVISLFYVGNIRRIFADDNSQNIKIETDVFYIDNGMHSGASGGPIVNEEGVALGVLTQRAITSAHQSNNSELKVPSGSSIGISLQILKTVSELRQKNNEISHR